MERRGRWLMILCSELAIGGWERIKQCMAEAGAIG
jgi:hypothetical protein